MYDGDIIDPHHHFWQLRRSYPWLQGPPNPDRFTGDDSEIRVDYLPDDLRADFGPARLVGTVHVEAGAGDSLEEAEWLQGLHDSGELPTAIVAGANLIAPNAVEHLERLAALSAVHGVRHILNWHPDPNVTYVDRNDLMVDPLWLANFGRLAGLGLRFDLQVYPSQLIQAAQLAADHPDTRVILNHTAMPLSHDPDHVALWTAGIDALAAQPNAAIKISGLGMTDHSWTVDSLRPFVRHSIEAFGTKRAMFGSNFPVDRIYSDLPTLYDAFDELTSELSDDERADLFAETARRVYDLSIARPGKDLV